MKLRIILRRCVLAGALSLVAFSGFAQRQTPGRPSVDGYVSLGQDFRPAGGGVYWCNYDFVGRTHFGIDVFRQAHTLHEDAILSNGTEVYPAMDHDFMGTDICASAGYMFRFLSTRSRSVVLSGGAHLLLGAKYAPEIAQYKKNERKNYSAVGVYIGLVPELQLEAFMAKNVSLYVSARPRARLYTSLGGKDDWFLFTTAAGLKVYL